MRPPFRSQDSGCPTSAGTECSLERRQPMILPIEGLARPRVGFEFAQIPAAHRRAGSEMADVPGTEVAKEPLGVEMQRVST